MSAAFLKIVTSFEELERHFNSIDSLSADVKAEAVEHARNILEKLRFYADEDGGGEKRDKDEDMAERATMLLQLSQTFLALMAEIAKLDASRREDKEYSALFESTRNAIGKISYKVRSDIINTLIKHGKHPHAHAMRTQLEDTTPPKFKTLDVPFRQMVKTLEAGLSKAMFMRSTLGLGKKAADAVHSGVHTQAGYQIVGVNKKELIDTVQKVNEEPLTTVVGSKIVGVSNKSLVDTAKQVNEASIPGLNPNLTTKI